MPIAHRSSLAEMVDELSHIHRDSIFYWLSFYPAPDRIDAGDFAPIVVDVGALHCTTYIHV